MSFDPKELLNKVGGNDLVKNISDKVGVGADQAQKVAHDLLAKAEAQGSGLVENAKEIAEKNGVSVEKVEAIAQNLGATIQSKADQLGDAATGAFSGVLDKIKASPLGDAVNKLDKDGDGNPINDLAAGAKDFIGNIFGKK